MELLLEINVEEMPPSHVRTAMADLRERLVRELTAAKIEAGGLRALSTTRRLVLTGELPPGQPDREEVVTGPSKAAAFAADGSPTPAALGFARSKGVAVADLQIVRTAKGEYVGVRKLVKGRATRDVLAKAVPQAVASLSFPKMMRWGEGSMRFSRPIRGLLCVLGGEVVPFELDGLPSTDATAGHKLHRPDRFTARSFAEYEAGLRERLVTIDPEERKRSVLAQIEARLAPLQASLYPDPELLDKLVNDIECPFVFLGAFDPAYLNLPIEILSTALREGQKLFSAVRDGKQIPVFLGVADATGDPKGYIRAGNERVLKARLEDARFFWEQDRKIRLAKRAASLKHVLFQEKLGTYDDKARRLEKMAVYLRGKLEEGPPAKDLAVAASLCKADLVTDMVREFPSLQGIVGGLYARDEGLTEDVSRAIYEHYRPAGLEDESPASLGGAILSIADKLDSIVGVLGIGVQITGSSDPFGLRRNAQSLCKVVLDHKLSFSFPRLLDRALAAYGERLRRPHEDIASEVIEFFTGRLRYLLEREGFRYDLVNAALGAGMDDILHAQLRVRALDRLKGSPQFEPMILMAKRVNNILGSTPPYPVSAALLAEPAEKELHALFAIIRDNAEPMIVKGDFDQAQRIVFRIQPALNAFFDRVLVMAEEARLRRNRLGLLQAIRKVLLRIADYAQVVVEGEKPRREPGAPPAAAPAAKS